MVRPAKTSGWVVIICTLAARRAMVTGLIPSSVITRAVASDVVDHDGHLRCVAGAPVGGGYYGTGPYNNGYYGGSNAAGNGPNGSYTRTCMDINIQGNDLHARCQTNSGEVHNTKLDDYRKCHSDIINDNGNLRCQR